MAPRTAGFRLSVLVSLLAFCFACFGLVGSARAADYSPPTTPFTEPFYATSMSCGSLLAEPEDPTHQWLRKITSFVLTACRVGRESDTAARERQFWITAELLHVQEKIQILHADQVEASEQRATTNSLLTTIRERLESPLAVEIEGVDEGSPLAVQETDPGAFSAPVAASVDASGEAIKGGIWFLIGAAIAAIAGYMIYRQVMPRA